MIRKENVADIYRLSPLQEGILFHSIYDDGEKRSYVIQNRFRLTGPLDHVAFEKAWRTLLARHEVFRTVIRYKKTPYPLAMVLKEWPARFNYVDLGALNGDARAASLDDTSGDLLSRPMDVTVDPLFMVNLFRIDNETHELILTFHHIIMDAWSMELVHDEFIHLYRQAVGDSLPPLPPAVPYGAYSGWLQKQDIPTAESYWRDYLHGYEGIATITPEPLIAPPPLSTMREKSYRLTEEQSRRLTSLASELGLTLNNVIQCVWGLILGATNDRDDVIFGAVISGRDDHIDGAEKIVGPFINTLPVRLRLDDHLSFVDFARQSAADFVQGIRYQYFPLSRIQKVLGPDSTLFDHIVVFENLGAEDDSPKIVHDDGRTLSFANVSAHSFNHYPFSLNVTPGDRIGFRFSFDTSRYGDDQMDRLFGRIETVVSSVIDRPHGLIGEIPILADRERELLLHQFNRPSVPFPETATVADLFEAVVAKTPDKIALRIDDTRLTYSELDERAAMVAHQLVRRHGAHPDDRVAILLDRSAEMIIALLGILKAGAAFVPIDPNYPAQRIDYLLRNCRASAVITDEPHMTLARKTIAGEAILNLTDEAAEPNLPSFARTAHAGHLAYIIFTSGSTGNPKGVMIENRSVVNMALALARGFGVTPDSNVGQFASLSFDFSLSEIFMPLLTGATLTLIPKEIIDDIGAFVGYLTDQKVTDIKLPPSYLAALNRAELPTVTTITSAGETIKPDDAFHYAARQALFNEYGPTECCVGTTIIRVTEAMRGAGPIPIGRPIDNYRLYILDRKGRLAPLGSTGELHIAGAGVARGYFDDEALTAARFVVDPFNPAERMYRTGDMVRWRPDGAVEFVGRRDFQVKVRGFRVEPGEIEARLLAHPDIDAAAVTVALDRRGENALFAFYTTLSTPPSAHQLRAFLAETLPAHMIPGAFYPLTALPLTPNGKIDRKALQTLSQEEAPHNEHFAPAANEMEERLAAIMATALKQERFGATDDFFENGGNSISALMAVARMQADVSPTISLPALFARSTPRALARYLAEVNDYSDRFDESIPAVFNDTASRGTLFLFPPPVGYGVVYRGLAASLPDVRLVCLNFIEEENRIERSLDIIRAYQPNGPYRLGGYSSGGNVAFEVAKMAEASGMSVDALLLVDSWRKERPISESHRRRQKKLIANLDVMVDLVKKDEDLRALEETGYVERHLRDRIERYNAISATMVNAGAVEADIYLLTSASFDYDDELAPTVTRDWSDSTSGKYHVVQGFGDHDEMLEGDDLPKNGEKLREMVDLMFYSGVGDAL